MSVCFLKRERRGPGTTSRSSWRLQSSLSLFPAVAPVSLFYFLVRFCKQNKKKRRRRKRQPCVSLCHKQLLIGLREGKIPFPSSLRLICDWPFHVAQLSARKLFPPFSDNADDTFLHFVAPSRSNSETRSATGRPKSTGICSFPHRLLFSLLVPTNLIDSHRSFDPEERTSSVEKSWAVVIKLLPSAIVILSAS